MDKLAILEMGMERPRQRTVSYIEDPDLLWLGLPKNARLRQIGGRAYEDLNLHDFHQIIRSYSHGFMDFGFYHIDVPKKIRTLRQDALEELFFSDALRESIDSGLRLSRLAQETYEKAMKQNREKSSYDYKDYTDYRMLFESSIYKMGSFLHLYRTMNGESHVMKTAKDFVSQVVENEDFYDAYNYSKMMSDGKFLVSVDKGNVFIHRRTAEKGDDTIAIDPGIAREMYNYFYKAISGVINSKLSRSSEKFKSSLDCYVALAKYYKELAGKDVEITRPVASGRRNMNLVDAVNPLFVKLITPIPNDCNYDENSRIFVVTGSNSGGKTSYMKTIGLIQALGQMGFLVPARHATIPDVDAIYTHFVAPDNPVEGESRFVNEGRRVVEIMKAATDRSLVLLDEPFGGTSTGGSVSQTFDMLKGFERIGCATYLTTHIHELAQKVKQGEVNAKNLRVGVIEDDGKIEFTFKIEPGAAGKSYATEVAKKFGFGAEQINEIIDKRLEKGELKRDYNALALPETV